MSYLNEPVKITPTDFSNFVYCGIKWAFMKGRWVEEYYKDKIYIQSEEQAEKRIYREKGQKNESKCLEWVMKNNKKAKILYVGIDKSSNYLESTLEVRGRKMKCKPDLIIQVKDKVKLFEFKCVSKKEYLTLDEFESDHAQIWCYTKISGIYNPQKIYLLRYFVNPFKDGHNQLKDLSGNIIGSSIFDELFYLYSEAVNILETEDISDPSNIANTEYEKIFNPPTEDNDIARKCSSCHCNYFCQLRGWKRKKIITNPYFQHY